MFHYISRLYLKTTFSLLITLFAAVTFAEVNVHESIAISSGLHQWSQNLKENLANKRNTSFAQFSAKDLECAWIQETPEAMLCTGRPDPVFETFLRASVSIEGPLNFPVGTIPQFSNPVLAQVAFLGPGFDLTGKDLLRFFQKAESLCLKESKDLADSCLNPHEREFFYNFLIPTLKEHPNLVIITDFLKLQSLSWRDKILEHEFYHAQFFNNKKFQEATEQFFRANIAPKDKITIINSLKALYNHKDKLLMLNEFQAYLLIEELFQDDIQYRYRNAFIKFLKQNGIEILRPEKQETSP